jgi:hypothetical protein
MKAVAATLFLLLLSACEGDSRSKPSAPSPKTYDSVLDLAAALEREGLGCNNPDTGLKGYVTPRDTEAATCNLTGDFAQRNVTLLVNLKREEVAVVSDGLVGVAGANWAIATTHQRERQAQAIIGAIGGREVPTTVSPQP